jgi:hypothetical protein
MSMVLDNGRISQLYKLLFDEIKRIQFDRTLDARDKSFLVESLKEQIGRIEHHELGETCPCTDTDFVETGRRGIAAFVLKCRIGKPMRTYEREVHLGLSEAVTKAKGYTIPLMIETTEIDEWSRKIGVFRDMEWANTGLKREGISKDEWIKFHHDIRNLDIDIALRTFFKGKS